MENTDKRVTSKLKDLKLFSIMFYKRFGFLESSNVITFFREKAGRAVREDSHSI